MKQSTVPVPIPNNTAALDDHGATIANPPPPVPPGINRAVPFPAPPQPSPSPTRRQTFTIPSSPLTQPQGPSPAPSPSTKSQTPSSQARLAQLEGNTRTVLDNVHNIDEILVNLPASLQKEGIKAKQVLALGGLNTVVLRTLGSFSADKRIDNIAEIDRIATRTNSATIRVSVTEVARLNPHLSPSELFTLIKTEVRSKGPIHAELSHGLVPESRTGNAYFTFKDINTRDSAAEELRATWPSTTPCALTELDKNFQICITNCKASATFEDYRSFVHGTTGENPIGVKYLANRGHAMITVATEEAYEKLLDAHPPDYIGGLIEASFNPYFEAGTSRYMTGKWNRLSANAIKKILNTPRVFAKFVHLQSNGLAVAWIPDTLSADFVTAPTFCYGQMINKFKDAGKRKPDT